MNKFSPGTPASRLWLSLGFKRLLPAGVTLQSATGICVVHPTSAVPDPGASDRLEGTAAVQADQQTASQFFSGGLAGVDYIITFRGTYTDGEIEPIDAVLQIRAYNDVGTS